MTMPSPEILFSRRLRQTPFEQRVREQNARGFTTYNHMSLAGVYRSFEQDYAHLCEHVQLWDVACERQVEVVGPDALALVELITPREIADCAVGQSKYAPLVDEFGGLINDPIMLRLAEDRFWISIADSDVLLWVKGIAYGRGMRVAVFEPDVSPLAVQGPKADDLMAQVVGEQVRDIRRFDFITTDIAATPVLLARSGWSGQGGFEIYLQDSTKGLALWDTLWRAGQQYQVRAGCPNLIERIETGLLSYGSDMTLANNPYECGLDKYCDPDKPAEYMARAALKKIAAQGVTQKKVNLKISAPEAMPAPRSTWPVKTGHGATVGAVTSLAYSPRFAANLCFAMVQIACADPGTRLVVEANGVEHVGVVADRHWQDATRPPA